MRLWKAVAVRVACACYHLRSTYLCQYPVLDRGPDPGSACPVAVLMSRRRAAFLSFVLSTPTYLDFLVSRYTPCTKSRSGISGESQPCHRSSAVRSRAPPCPSRRFPEYCSFPTSAKLPVSQREYDQHCQMPVAWEDTSHRGYKGFRWVVSRLRVARACEVKHKLLYCEFVEVGFERLELCPIHRWVP
ncbi:hypothetical protein DFP72DRAFT_585687 [Ephemerocybe angulata]|uniref:Uncharacterized protein n=1 Tax=Ephemerocybe angulata TaxID=980116 RepID=A0A8H6HL82_9AGAR|nr:hypothetical protein DFP72DRAFT_585687 [Tulosesus angulatus]